MFNKHCHVCMCMSWMHPKKAVCITPSLEMLCIEVHHTQRLTVLTLSLSIKHLYFSPSELLSSCILSWTIVKFQTTNAPTSGEHLNCVGAVAGKGVFYGTRIKLVGWALMASRCVYLSLLVLVLNTIISFIPKKTIISSLPFLIYINHQSDLLQPMHIFWDRLA